MKYNWILFDADDTLFDFHRSALYAFQRTLEVFSIDHREEHFGIYKQINEQAWVAFEKKEITAAVLRKIRFERFLAAIGESRDPLEMNGRYLSELSQNSFLLAGAMELVSDLNQTHRLGLITNGLKEVQRPRVVKARMDHYFQVIVVSDEIGVSKPHPEFFQHAFEMMGFPEKNRVLVVGDSLSSDIQGGNGFGIDTCWFNPKGLQNQSDHQPTFEIGQLEQLRNIIQS